MTYTAYLRIYEPVSVFHERDRSRRAGYALWPGRPRRRDGLPAERGEALRRVTATPRVAVATYLRARRRWRAFADLERAN